MADPIEDNEEIHDLAIEALRVMLDKFGPEHKFPTDAIWQFIPGGHEILSTKKPHQPRRLTKEGYLQDTGAKTKALSGPRAGSPTTEYRFGPLLVPEHTDPVVSASIRNNGRSESVSHSYSAAIVRIKEAMESEGYIISSAELANFILALAVSPFVILSGISGTGKSLLPRKFAKLTSSQFYSIPVQPQWSDNSDLFGYTPSLNPGAFVKGKLVDAILAAKNTPESLAIVLLDEMNLAPVEHYFSDFLSITETRERRSGGGIGSDTLPIDLPLSPDPEFISICDDLNKIELPNNLRVIGTANMDETTHTFSPKVLDRAFTIELDDPDLTAFAISKEISESTFPDLARALIKNQNAINIMEAQADSQDVFEHVAELLDQIQTILSPAGIKFGYRTRDSILLYLHFWRQFGLSDVLAGSAALDFCILQKVLPKISGSGDMLEEALKSLGGWLEVQAENRDSTSDISSVFSGPLARSQEKVLRMLNQLEVNGTTHYWGI